MSDVSNRKTGDGLREYKLFIGRVCGFAAWLFWVFRSAFPTLSIDIHCTDTPEECPYSLSIYPSKTGIYIAANKNAAPKSGILLLAISP